MYFVKTKLQAWIEYFENVLGVADVVYPDLRPGEPSEVQVLFLGRNKLSSEGDELLQKMVKAMKLQSSRILIPLGSLEDLPKAQYYVCFSNDIFLSIESANKILTLNPEELLKNQNLKKKSWDDLQIVMRALQEISL